MSSGVPNGLLFDVVRRRLRQHLVGQRDLCRCDVCVLSPCTRDAPGAPGRRMPSAPDRSHLGLKPGPRSRRAIAHDAVQEHEVDTCA